MFGIGHLGILISGCHVDRDRDRDTKQFLASSIWDRTATPATVTLNENRGYLTWWWMKACFPINEIHVINFFHKQPSAGWISMSDLRPLGGKLAGAI
jgi:hypothetical protein